MTFSVGFALIAFTVMLLPAPMRADEWTKQWAVSGKPDLHIEADDASITIEAGSGNEVTALVQTRGISIGGSGLRVIEHQSGNRVDLEVRQPSSHFNFGMRSIEVRVKAPQDLMADVHTGDGSVKLEGLRGSLRIGTGDGSIQGEDLDGALEAHTGDGSLHIRGRFDMLRVKTNDGSVDVQAQSGSQIRSDWRVETGDGSVHLGVPRNLSADVELRTGDGSIHTDLPVTMNGSHSEHEVHGKINGGGPLIDVKTGDGSIILSAL